MTGELAPFNYSLIPADVAELARTSAHRIRERHRDTVQRMIATGAELAELKGRLPHGAWLPWLHAECRISERTAQMYMQVHRRFSGELAAYELDYGVVRLLAQTNVPDELVDDVLAGRILPDEGAIRAALPGRPPAGARATVKGRQSAEITADEMLKGIAEAIERQTWAATIGADLAAYVTEDIELYVDAAQRWHMGQLWAWVGQCIIAGTVAYQGGEVGDVIGSDREGVENGEG